MYTVFRKCNGWVDADVCLCDDYEYMKTEDEANELMNKLNKQFKQLCMYMCPLKETAFYAQELQDGEDAYKQICCGYEYIRPADEIDKFMSESNDSTKKLCNKPCKCKESAYYVQEVSDKYIEFAKSIKEGKETA